MLVIYSCRFLLIIALSLTTSNSPSVIILCISAFSGRFTTGLIISCCYSLFFRPNDPILSVCNPVCSSMSKFQLQGECLMSDGLFASIRFKVLFLAPFIVDLDRDGLGGKPKYESFEGQLLPIEEQSKVASSLRDYSKRSRIEQYSFSPSYDFKFDCLLLQILISFLLFCNTLA